MAPLRALLLSDGRPGHYHLSDGVLAALARLRPVETVRVAVRRSRLVPGRLLALLVAAGLGPRLVLRLGYGVDGRSLPSADLVVSAGGDTLAANVAAARLLGAPNIFYGSLRRFRPEDFALVLTSHARFAGRARHVVTLKPSAVDPATLPPLDRPRVAKDVRAPSVAGLLVGGDTATVRYGPDDWTRLGAFLSALSQAAGTRWIVSNSRRTPKAANDMLTRLAAEPRSPVERFIDVRSAGSGTLGALFARAEAILCTVDSSSMVSEAVWMRRPVLAVAPDVASLPANEQDYRGYLESRGWARSLNIADLTPERALAELAAITPLAENPLDLLAATLADRLPELARRDR